MKFYMSKPKPGKEVRVVVEGVTKDVTAILQGAWANANICAMLEDRNAGEIPVWATLDAYMRYAERKSRKPALKAWERCIKGLLGARISFFAGREKYSRAGMNVFGFTQFFEESGYACFSIYAPAARFLREGNHYTDMFFEEANGALDVELPPPGYEPFAHHDGSDVARLLQEILQ